MKRDQLHTVPKPVGKAMSYKTVWYLAKAAMHACITVDSNVTAMQAMLAVSNEFNCTDGFGFDLTVETCGHTGIRYVLISKRNARHAYTCQSDVPTYRSITAAMI